MHAALSGLVLGGVTMRLSAAISAHTEAGIADGLGAAEVAALRGNFFSVLRLVVPLINNKVR